MTVIKKQASGLAPAALAALFLPVLISFILIAGCQNASASGMLGIELKAGAYFQNLSGNLSIGNPSGILPTKITPSDIGLETAKTEPAFKVGLFVLYDNEISFSYIPYEYSGSRTLSQNINFNGTAYNANTDVTSKLDLYSYKMFYTRDFEFDRYVTFGLGLGVDVITAKAQLDSSYASESRNINLPVPLLGAKIKISPTKEISVTGKFEGFSIGQDGYYYHASAGVNYDVVGPLSVYADYLYDKVHVDYNDVDGSLVFDGPEAGMRLRF
jgi:hypothetical protein